MNRDLVLDASAALAVARGEPTGANVRFEIARAASAGGTVIVPDHFWLECANVLRRRYRWDGASIIEALHLFDTFAPRTVEVDRVLLLQAIDLSERHGLTPYDATYLAIAMVEDARILTLDRELAREAAARLIPLEDSHRLHEQPAPYEHDVSWPLYKEISAYLADLRAEALGRA